MTNRTRPATAPLVLLTDPIDARSQESLSQVASVLVVSVNGTNWLEAAREASIIVVRSPIPESLPAQAQKLLGFVRYGAGVDMIPVAEASRHGIAVANAPNANSNAVVEYVIGQLLNLARKLSEVDRIARATGWHAARALAPSNSELRGKTIAIVGMGNIGGLLAQKCQAAFDMKVIAVRRPNSRNASQFASASLEEAASQADALVLACPLTNETRHLISTRILGLMKPGAWLINVSRGPVVDENALVHALEEGKLGGAALDVFTSQPLPSDSQLLALPNVLLSPHVAGITDESLDLIGQLVIQQTLALLSGKLPQHLVNRDSSEAISRRLARLGASP